MRSKRGRSRVSEGAAAIASAGREAEADGLSSGWPVQRMKIVSEFYQDPHVFLIRAVVGGRSPASAVDSVKVRGKERSDHY